MRKKFREKSAHENSAQFPACQWWHYAKKGKNKGMPNRAQKANGTGTPLASRKFSPEDTPPSGEFSGSLQVSHDEARQFQNDAAFGFMLHAFMQFTTLQRSRQTVVDSRNAIRFADFIDKPHRKHHRNIFDPGRKTAGIVIRKRTAQTFRTRLARCANGQPPA